MMSVYGVATKKAFREYVCRGDGAGCHDAPGPETLRAAVMPGEPRRRIPTCRAVLVLQETSCFGPELRSNGKFSVVGPAPLVRKWFALVTVRDGRIVKVQ